MSLNDGYTSTSDLQEQGRTGPSDGTLWFDCPWSQLKNDFGRGYTFEDDFTGAHDLTNKYTLTQATTGTFLLIDEEGGVADLDCASSIVTRGGNVQYGSGVGEFASTQAAGKMWFEARVKATDIGSSGPEFFLGLHNIKTAIIASSAMDATASDWIGFKSLTDDSILLGTAANNAASSAETTASDIHTFVDGTYVNLGFKVTNRDKVEFYVDGVKQTNTVAANIPTALMVPSLVCQSDGTVDTIISIDWWMCAVEMVST